MSGFESKRRYNDNQAEDNGDRVQRFAKRSETLQHRGVYKRICDTLKDHPDCLDGVKRRLVQRGYIRDGKFSDTKLSTKT